jgi:dTDP-4-dehydrorhamnose reductase
MKVLIIGAAGQIGSALGAALAPRHQTLGTVFKAGGTLYPVLDIRDSVAVRTCLERTRPDHAVLTAALTNVDYCQLHPDMAQQINVDGTAHVAGICRDLGLGLTFFSTDYIFDGTAGPYAEDDPARPQSVYGQTKWAGEQIVTELVPAALIVRTTVVYSYAPGSKNFFMQVLEKLGQGEVMTVPQDQMGNPTHVWNLAQATAELLEQGASGVYNLTGTSWLPRSDFARAIAEKIGADPHLIRPVATSSLGQAAPRPLNGGLKTGKAQARLREHPLWNLDEGLDFSLAQLRDGKKGRAFEGGPHEKKHKP